MGIVLGKEDIYPFLMTFLVYGANKLMNDHAFVSGGVDPAKLFRLEGRISEAAKPHTRPRIPQNRLVCARGREQQTFHQIKIRSIGHANFDSDTK